MVRFSSVIGKPNRPTVFRKPLLSNQPTSEEGDVALFCVGSLTLVLEKIYLTFFLYDKAFNITVFSVMKSVAFARGPKLTSLL